MQQKKWKEYEEKTLSYLQAKHPYATFKKNVQLTGHLSEQKREIDILIENNFFGVSIQIAVECKNWKNKLDVADIGSFIDKLKDVGISKGIMISRNGYTKSAHVRARKEVNIQLQVLDFENLPEYYGFWGLPYRGNLGAIISAPNGWIVNNNVSHNLHDSALCFLHPLEFSVEDSFKTKNFMYFQLRPIIENTDCLNLKSTLQHQDEIVKQNDRKAEIIYWEEIIKSEAITFRKICYFKEKYYEYTAGLDFGDFLAYCVYCLPHPFLPDDEARLRFIIENLYLLKNPIIDPLNSHDFWHFFTENPLIIFE
jgi:hypothetical protein